MKSTKKCINILIIDDDDDEHLLMRKHLSSVKNTEYHFHGAMDFKSGLDEILTNKYDVCLIDYRLDPDNGLELLRTAIKAECKSPLIMLTGQGNQDIDLEAMESGAMDYLNKNEVTPQLLERTIRYAIERKKTELQLKRLNQELRHLSEYDLLTNLPNRNQFNKLFPIITERCERYHQFMAVMFLDLDKFKEVNDTLGHNYGDLLLQKVANRLKNNIRKIDYIFRLGGDEFVIVVANATKENIAKQAQLIIKNISDTFQLNEHAVSISISIGIAISESNVHIDHKQLLKNADDAMYHAKRKGRNNFQFSHVAKVPSVRSKTSAL